MMDSLQLKIDEQGEILARYLIRVSHKLYMKPNERDDESE